MPSEEHDLYPTELADAPYIGEKLPGGAEGNRSPKAPPSLDAAVLGLLERCATKAPQ